MKSRFPVCHGEFPEVIVRPSPVNCPLGHDSPPTTAEPVASKIPTTDLGRYLTPDRNIFRFPILLTHRTLLHTLLSYRSPLICAEYSCITLPVGSLPLYIFRIFIP